MIKGYQEKIRLLLHDKMRDKDICNLKKSLRVFSTIVNCNKKSRWSDTGRNRRCETHIMKDLSYFLDKIQD